MSRIRNVIGIVRTSAGWIAVWKPAQRLQPGHGSDGQPVADHMSFGPVPAVGGHLKINQIIAVGVQGLVVKATFLHCARGEVVRSEEHPSELQSLMSISFAVSCLKKKK